MKTVYCIKKKLYEERLYKKKDYMKKETIQKENQTRKNYIERGLLLRFEIFQIDYSIDNFIQFRSFSLS